MTVTRFVAIALSGAIVSVNASAQSLANRVASASDRSVQFTYKARPGVCGDGRTYISTGPGNFYGFYSSDRAEQCQAGPVRVVLDLADRNVVALRTYVGTPSTDIDAGVANLGNVTPADAADFLLGVAGRADGRVGRDAIFAALLGDSVDVSSRLLTIGRDANRPLETRRAALAGLARSDSRELDGVGTSLVQIATNESDVQGAREEALRVLSRLDHGAGIQPLIRLANTNTTSWIGRESMRVLASSGDPRARDFLRATVQRSDLPDDLLAAAIRGLGRNYVTGQDANLLRSLYPKLTGERSRDAVLASIADLGGADNVQWLTSVVRNEQLTSDARRRALAYLSRAGAPTATLVALYDPLTDPQLRGELISIYSRAGDKAATDKLVWIARNEQNYQLKRRAIGALSRNSDPAIRSALQDIVER
ncbi:MAG TPA: HEAT repeat domain-containing protein [Gemmatimonadaceae bacterium]|jgi:HEAT repeat protein|nr:HEAT repeat domain-containing protein [Gemmatimonadaceae bacterium]